MKNSLRKIFGDQAKIIEARAKGKTKAPREPFSIEDFATKYVKPEFSIATVYDEIRQFNSDEMDALTYAAHSSQRFGKTFVQNQQRQLEQGLSGVSIDQAQQDWLRCATVYKPQIIDNTQQIIDRYQIRFSPVEPQATTQHGVSWFHAARDSIRDMHSIAAEIAETIRKADLDPVQEVLDGIDSEILPLITLGFPQIFIEHRELNATIEEKKAVSDFSHSSVLIPAKKALQAAKTRRQALSIELSNIVQEMR
jgi:hypothetical protein